MLNIKNKIDNFIAKFNYEQPLAAKIVSQIHAQGGEAIIVGGAVRDLFIGIETKDLDIEVYGLLPEQLEKILGQFGVVQQVGKAFGVYLILGINIDWSLPRIDSTGRKPEVHINHNLDFVTAFKRRDLTINAMGINLKTNKLIDLFNGLQDLQAKILRYIDAKLFVQDPLRVYRVMQFMGRFEMMPEQGLNELCAKIDISQVSLERVEQEFSKLFLKSKSPSLGLRWLEKIGKLKEIMPELVSTIGVLQNPAWHPEGDVFEHTMQALDASARQEYADKCDKIVIMWAAVCHDLGKAYATKMVDGVWRSIGHAQVGVPLAKNLLMRISSSKNLIKTVCKLVRYHMEPLQLVRNGASLVAYKKLAIELYPQTMRLLTQLVLADRSGRQKLVKQMPIRLSFEQDSEVQKFVDQAKLAGVWEQIETPVLQGKDLLEFVKPGPNLGRLLKEAYLIQLQENILDREMLKKRILRKVKDR